MAFLFVVFTTFSLAAASPDGNYPVCIPTVPGAYAVFLQPSNIQIPSALLSRQVGDYICTYVDERYAGRATLRIVYPGATETVDEEAYVDLGDVNGVSYTVIYYVDSNVLNVVSTAVGHNYVALEFNVPKYLARSYTRIRGPVVFTNPDPVLRVFLVPEDGKPAAVRFEVLGVSQLPPEKSLPQPKVEFAACNVRVSNEKARVIKIGDRAVVTGSFQIFVNGTPAIVPNIHVIANGKIFAPQVSADDRTYSFMIPYTTGLATVTVTGRIPGCSQLSHEIPVTESSGYPSWVLFAVVLVAAIVAYVLHKKREEAEG